MAASKMESSWVATTKDRFYNCLFYYFEQVKIDGYFAEFGDVKIVNHFANFEQVKTMLLLLIFLLHEKKNVKFFS